MEKEAVSIVKNLPIFMKTEWNIDPEKHCYAQFLQDGDKWDESLRVANNADTDDIALAVKEQTLDLQREAEQDAQEIDNDNESMTSKARREMRRMLNADAETVASLLKEKKSTAPTTIAVDDTSIAMSGMSAASSKTSVIKARLQQEFESKLAAQQLRVDEMEQDKKAQEDRANKLETQLHQMQAMLSNLQKQVQTRPSSVCAQSSQPPSSLTDSNPNPPDTAAGTHNNQDTEMRSDSQDGPDTQDTPVELEDTETLEPSEQSTHDAPTDIGATVARMESSEQDAEDSYQRLYEYIYAGMVSQLVNPSQADLDDVADTAEAEARRLNAPSMDSNMSGVRSMSYESDNDPTESMDISETDPLAIALPDSDDSAFQPDILPPDITSPRRSARSTDRGESPGRDR